MFYHTLIMNSKEIVTRAIEFTSPPRIPFFQHQMPGAPDDVCDIWEMDRAAAGWFFDRPGPDDWGCVWQKTEMKNMGQVVEHPLASWEALPNYRPPDPTNPFYYERIEPLLRDARDRYVVVTCHFTLIERLHMLCGFEAAMRDFYLEPRRIEHVLDMILDFKLGQLEQLAKRFGDRIHGIFLTDDWGTQKGLFVGKNIFDRFFASRYQRLFDTIHRHGWHVLLHSCGKINALVPRLIDLGVDVLNMQQPNAYGLVEFGEQFKGRVCFLTTVDIQSTLPKANLDEIRREAQALIRHWSTHDGGFIVFNYGDESAIGTTQAATRAMFDEFVKLQHYWSSTMDQP